MVADEGLRSVFAHGRRLVRADHLACHHIDERVEFTVGATLRCGRLKSRLWPMRDLKRLHSAQVLSADHAFV